MIMTWMTVNMGTLPVLLIPSVDQLSRRKQGCLLRLLYLLLLLFCPLTPLLRLFTFPPHLVFVRLFTFSVVAAVCSQNCNNLNSAQSCWQQSRFVLRSLQVSCFQAKFKHSQCPDADDSLNSFRRSQKYFKPSETLGKSDKKTPPCCHIMCPLLLLPLQTSQRNILSGCSVFSFSIPLSLPYIPSPYIPDLLSPLPPDKATIVLRCCLIWRASRVPLQRSSSAQIGSSSTVLYFPTYLCSTNIVLNINMI